MTPDHPRSRGVYRHSDVGPRVPRRIIPARAGFTPDFAELKKFVTDHPRSRGVYGPRSLHGQRLSGSSPLARGLHLPPEDRRGRRGIIPARAGFTSPVRPDHHERQDHPRSLGVYKLSWPRFFRHPGSSPLARGLPGPRCQSDETGADHPRSRGVYDALLWASSFSAGSSPLARGLQPRRGQARRPARIIPARAGFTATEEYPPEC